MNASRFMLIAAILIMVFGIVMMAVGGNYAVGATFLGLGVVFLAINAGKGRAKGGEDDH